MEKKIKHMGFVTITRSASRAARERKSDSELSSRYGPIPNLQVVLQIRRDHFVGCRHVRAHSGHRGSCYE